MGDTELEGFRQAWRERTRKDREKALERRHEALSAAQRAADFLRCNYGVKRVLLYGSLAWGDRFTPHSDIDLLVEGFEPSNRFWRMLAEIEEVTSPFPPSVVLADDASESLLRKVRDKGVEL